MSRIIKYCLLIIVVIISGSLSQEDDAACLTPQNIEGKCVHIYRCPPLNNILHEHATNEAAMNHLRDSQCGPDKDRTANVCCVKSWVSPLKVEPRS